MKPENILIFKDYKVKLGDFGCAIKFSSDSTDSTMSGIRGLTKTYSQSEIYEAFLENEEVCKKALFTNDCFCLYQTFIVVQNTLESILNKESLFSEMIKDLSDLNVSLKDKVLKYEKHFKINQDFIFKLS